MTFTHLFVLKRIFFQSNLDQFRCWIYSSGSIKILKLPSHLNIIHRLNVYPWPFWRVAGYFPLNLLLGLQFHFFHFFFFLLGDPAGARLKPGSGYGYGFGIRVDSPLGPLRLEYAFNDKHAKRFHFGVGHRN